MRWLNRLMGGAHALVRGKRAERELDEELRAYLDASIAENMRMGIGERGRRPRSSRRAR